MHKIQCNLTASSCQLSLHIPAIQQIIIQTREPAARTPQLVISMQDIVIKMNSCFSLLYPILNAYMFHILPPT